MGRMRATGILLIAGLLAAPVSAIADPAVAPLVSALSTSAAGAQASAISVSSAAEYAPVPTRIINDDPLVIFERARTGEQESVALSGGGTVSVAVVVAGEDPPPEYIQVFRFYNAGSGTHFYSANKDEYDHVRATLGHIFTYEGLAYQVNTATNTDSLYRFYNPGRLCHFYTAQQSEQARVASSLGHIYAYEGVGYRVSLEQTAGAAAVHRFYNVRTGTHFYTADESERADVANRLGAIFTYEGVGFWLAP